MRDQPKAPWTRKAYQVLLLPRTIVAAAALFLAVVLLVTYYERRRSRHDALLLMQSTAETMAYTIAASSEHATLAVRKIEHELLDGLLLRLRLLRELEQTGRLDNTGALAYTAATGLRVIRLDPAGRVTLASVAEDCTLTNDPAVWGAAVLPLLTGGVTQAVLDLRPLIAPTSHWKAVAAACATGNILILAPPAAYFDYRYSMGLGTIIQRIAAFPHIAYMVWQDDAGIISAAGDVETAFQIEERGTPQAAAAARKVKEFVVPASLAMSEGGRGIFRIGVSTDELHRIERDSFARMCATVIIVLGLSAALLHISRMRLQYEQERERGERLASIGNLAAGVAHEVRNPLNAVALTLQQLLSETRPAAEDADNATLLTVACDEIKRANATLTHFLDYAKPPRLVRRPANVNTICENVGQLVRATAERQKISIRYELRDVPEAPIDPEQTHQAVMNLALNAMDAMPEGGVLAFASVARRATVEIHVSDTGGGIAAEDRERVFDLYYTTKHKGVGLGLPFVHRIVTMHGGSVTVSAHEPHGTCVVLSFPLHPEPA